MIRRLLPLALVALAVAAGVALLVSGGDESEPEVFEFVVPAGAGRPDGPSTTDLFPRRLEVEVGDTLVIDNRADRSHTVGPYTVAPGQRLEHRFTDEGVIRGECTLHPSGEVTIVVG